MGGVLWLVLPAIYVAASNLAMVPLTGQNMPFLGLNSWADVVLVSGLATGVVFCLAGLEEPGGAGRITSYNVCYTKLLRFPGVPEFADVPRPLPRSPSPPR